MRLRDPHQRIAFVVAVHDVVTRRQLLDQRGFQQQRLVFAGGERHLHTRDLRDHAFDARIAAGAQEIAADALLQIARFPHVQQFVARAVHTINARLRGQLRQEGFRIEQVLSGHVQGNQSHLVNSYPLRFIASATEARGLPQSGCHSLDCYRPHIAPLVYRHEDQGLHFRRRLGGGIVDILLPAVAVVLQRI